MNSIILIIVCIIIFYSINKSYNENVYKKSDTDNNTYLIRIGNNKSEQFLNESVNTLAEINRRVLLLIDYLYEKYKYDHEKNYYIYHLKQNYHADKISEAAYDLKSTTYTVNKHDMHICLRTRDKNEILYDINLLMYVVLHELAHMCNYSKSGQPIIGHGHEFKQIFHFLVIEAINIGVYDYENYNESPKEYCGMVLNTQILH